MIYLADFTGHGVAAALNAARLHSFVHMMWQRTGRPAPLLRKLNQRLKEVLPIGQFATMFCATIDFAMQKVEYASAGAPQQLNRVSSEHPFEVISQSSLPLGVLRDVAYESKSRPFFEGGALILYSDGLVETPKPPKSILTPDHLRDLLNNNEQNKDAHQICQSIVGHLFSKQTIKATDDITLLIAKHRGGVARPSLIMRFDEPIFR